MQRAKHIIIGAGNTGIFLAKQLAALNHKVLLIEQNGVGGNSIHHTDLPSSIITKKSQEFSHNLKFFRNQQEKSKQLIAYRKEIIDYTNWCISQKAKEVEESFSNDKNIKLLKGKVRFIKRNTLEIYDYFSKEYKLLEYSNCYITAGKNCLEGLQVEGIQSVPVCHKWNYWKFDTVPNNISLIGFNEENLVKADIYSNLGIKVDVFEKKNSYECLEKMDLTATNYLMKDLIQKKVEFNFNSIVNKILYIDNKFQLYFDDGYKHSSEQLYIPSKAIMNGDYLNLKSLNLKYSKSGIVTNYKGNTNISNVFAFGSIVDSKNNKNSKSLENFLKFKELRNNRRSVNPIALVTNNLSTIQEEVRAIGAQYKSELIEIKTMNDVMTVGLSEAMVVYKQRVKPKIEIISHPSIDGFIKIIYHPKSLKVLGFATGGDLSRRYASFLKYSYSKQLKLSEILNFVKFDLFNK
jgi:pyruvate/2-oxoglutarate dehydrogenase complex dihydrolipoamide dehydrogenase (E3) component